jgi:hypothetical protein
MVKGCHMPHRLLLILAWLLLLPALSEAVGGYLLDRKSGAFKTWVGEEGFPECADGDVILWATAEGGTTGEWEICGAVTGESPSLQQSHAIGAVGGWTDLLEARPLTIWPEHDTLGPSAPRIRYYGESGNIIRECFFGDPADEPCQPETTHIPIGTSYRITYTGDSPATELEAGTLENVDGVLTGTGVFAQEGVDVSLYGANGQDNSTLDDAPAFQDAIDAAVAQVSAFGDGGGGVPPVFIPCGVYFWHTPITLKSPKLVSPGPARNCVSIYWEGTAGATAMQQTLTATYGGLENLAFFPGTTRPGTWLNLEGTLIDKHYVLNNVQFNGATDIYIKVGSWINAHWTNLRWDGGGNYALRLTPGGALNLSSFVIDKFTYDHRTTAGYTGAPGMILIDNSANASNWGLFSLKHGRIEMNNAWLAPQAIVTIKKSGSFPKSGCVKLEDVTYKDATGMTGDVVSAMEVSTGTECLILDNVRAENLSATLGGTWLTSTTARWPLPETQRYDGRSAIGAGKTQIVRDGIELFAPTAADWPMLEVWNGDQAFQRLTLDNAGKLSFGLGTSAVDASIAHTSVDRLSIDGYLQFTGNTPTMGTCGTSPSVVGTMMGGKITVGSGTVTACTMNFPLTWSNAPPCVVQNETTEQTLRPVSSTTALVINSSTSFAGDVINYICNGQQ